MSLAVFACYLLPFLPQYIINQMQNVSREEENVLDDEVKKVKTPSIFKHNLPF